MFVFITILIYCCCGLNAAVEGLRKPISDFRDSSALNVPVDHHSGNQIDPSHQSNVARNSNDLHLDNFLKSTPPNQSAAKRLESALSGMVASLTSAGSSALQSISSLLSMFRRLTFSQQKEVAEKFLETNNSSDLTVEKLRTEIEELIAENKLLKNQMVASQAVDKSGIDVGGNKEIAQPVVQELVIDPAAQQMQNVVHQKYPSLSEQDVVKIAQLVAKIKELKLTNMQKLMSKDEGLDYQTLKNDLYPDGLPAFNNEGGFITPSILFKLSQGESTEGSGKSSLDRPKIDLGVSRIKVKSVGVPGQAADSSVKKSKDPFAQIEADLMTVMSAEKLATIKQNQITSYIRKAKGMLEDGKYQAQKGVIEKNVANLQAKLEAMPNKEVISDDKSLGLATLKSSSDRQNNNGGGAIIAGRSFASKSVVGDRMSSRPIQPVDQNYVFTSNSQAALARQKTREIAEEQIRYDVDQEVEAQFEQELPTLQLAYLKTNRKYVDRDDFDELMNRALLFEKNTRMNKARSDSAQEITKAGNIAVALFDAKVKEASLVKGSQAPQYKKVISSANVVDRSGISDNSADSTKAKELQAEKKKALQESEAMKHGADEAKKLITERVVEQFNNTQRGLRVEYKFLNPEASDNQMNAYLKSHLDKMIFDELNKIENKLSIEQARKDALEAYRMKNNPVTQSVISESAPISDSKSMSRSVKRAKATLKQAAKESTAPKTMKSYKLEMTFPDEILKDINIEAAASIAKELKIALPKHNNNTLVAKQVLLRKYENELVNVDERINKVNQVIILLLKKSIENDKIRKNDGGSVTMKAKSNLSLV